MYKLVTVFFIAFSLKAAAQSELFSVGIEGGPGVASLYGNGSNKTRQENLTGFASGLTFQFNFKKNLALRSGVNYESKGAAYDIKLNSYTDHFQYLNVPLLLRISSSGKFKVIFNGGPFIGLLLKVTRHYDADAYSQNQNFDRDITFGYKHIDAGVAGGLGLSLHLKNKCIFSIEARDVLGLMNTTFQSEKKIKTNAFYFFAGLSYGIGERKNREKK
jgi:hypothetical protein